MKSHVLHTVWCYISGEAAGEFGNWSLLRVKGLIVTVMFNTKHMYVRGAGAVRRPALSAATSSTKTEWWRCRTRTPRWWRRWAKARSRCRSLATTWTARSSQPWPSSRWPSRCTSKWKAEATTNWTWTSTRVPSARGPGLQACGAKRISRWKWSSARDCTSRPRWTRTRKTCGCSPPTAAPRPRRTTRRHTSSDTPWSWTGKALGLGGGILSYLLSTIQYLKVKCKAQTTLAHIQVCIPDRKMPKFYRRSRITSRDIRVSSWKNPKPSENTIIWQGRPGPHFWRHTWHSPWDCSSENVRICRHAGSWENELR